MKYLGFVRQKLQGLKIYCRWKWHTFEEPIQRARIRAKLKGSGPVVVRFCSPGVGLSAHLNWCLWFAGWAERHGRLFRVECTSPNYGPGPQTRDWLPALLHQTSPFPEGRHPVVHVGRWEYLPVSQEGLPPLSMAEARALFRRHFAVTEHLLAQVRAFKRTHFGDDFVVGLHYRGTDKALEAVRIAYDDAVLSAERTLRAIVAHGVTPVLFLATDEAQFVRYVREKLPDFRVVVVEDSLRAVNDEPLHKAASNQGLRKAQEALLDALLLGESDLLIKTASGLSGWAPILGKEMPVVMLSEPFAQNAWFPDSAITDCASFIGQEATAVEAALEMRR